MNEQTKYRHVTLYWQTNEQTGGNQGWAYSVCDRDGYESGGFEIGAEDDGSERLSDVREAFARDAFGQAVVAQMSRWEALPEGGWRGSR